MALIRRVPPNCSSGFLRCALLLNPLNLLIDPPRLVKATVSLISALSEQAVQKHCSKTPLVLPALVKQLLASTVVTPPTVLKFFAEDSQVL